MKFCIKHYGWYSVKDRGGKYIPKMGGNSEIKKYRKKEAIAVAMRIGGGYYKLSIKTQVFL